MDMFDRECIWRVFIAYMEIRKYNECFLWGRNPQWDEVCTIQRLAFYGSDRVLDESAVLRISRKSTPQYKHRSPIYEQLPLSILPCAD